MKKTVLFLSLLSGVGFFAAAQQQETWMSLGFEFGNYFENIADSRNTYIGSPGKPQPEPPRAPKQIQTC
jgi:hypothetical protein